MNLYVEALIKDVSREGFVGADGENVEYYVNTLKNSDDEKIECNSKSDKFKEFEGKFGVATIEATKRDKGGFKLALRDFKVGISLDKEGEIVE